MPGYTDEQLRDAERRIVNLLRGGCWGEADALIDAYDLSAAMMYTTAFPGIYPEFADSAREERYE